MKPKRVAPTACGFSVTELIAVIAVVSTAMGDLLAAILEARDISRRSSCQEHLKQIGMALQSYHHTHGLFPIGCRKQQGFGPSWWVGLSSLSR